MRSPPSAPIATELHRSDPRWLIDDDKFDVAAELIARLGAALAPLERLKPGAHPLAELAKCHSAVISGLGRDGKGERRRLRRQ